MSLSHHMVRTGRKIQRTYLPGPERKTAARAGRPCYQRRSMSGGRRRVLVTVASPHDEDWPEDAKDIPSGPREKEVGPEGAESSP